MGFRQRAEPALEFLALGLAGALEGLHRDRLQDRERVLDAVIELLDQEVMEHLAAGDRCGHPHRKGEAGQKQHGAKRAGDRKIAPQRTDQGALRNASGHGPSGKRRSCECRDQRRALQRDGLQRCLSFAGHRGI